MELLLSLSKSNTAFSNNQNSNVTDIKKKNEKQNSLDLHHYFYGMNNHYKDPSSVIFVSPYIRIQMAKGDRAAVPLKSVNKHVLNWSRAMEGQIFSVRLYSKTLERACNATMQWKV